MSTHDDELLQQNIESGHPVNDGLDAHAYHTVFSALQKEPEYTLPPAFAYRLVQKIEARQKKRSIWHELRGLAAGIFLMIVGLGVTIYLTGFKPEFGVLKDARPYLSFIVFGVLFITLLNWVDRRFITRRKSAAAH